LPLLLVGIEKSISGNVGTLYQNRTTPPFTHSVNDKISEHSGIIVNLPKGVAAAGAAAKVLFEPTIKGEWVAFDLAGCDRVQTIVTTLTR